MITETYLSLFEEQAPLIEREAQDLGLDPEELAKWLWESVGEETT